MKSNQNARRTKPKDSQTKFTVGENAELMKFLIVSMPHKNRNNIKSMLANKQVFVDGKAIKQFNHPLLPGQEVEVRWNRIPEEKKYRGITIVFEDNDLIIIDKHAKMLSIATDNKLEETAYNMLSKHVKSQGNDSKIFVVHRLDKDTSGLMMFAKSEQVKQELQKNWSELVTERTYIAIVEGSPEKTEGTITSYLRESKALIVHSSQNPKDGTKAITNYQVMRVNKDFSMLKVSLETGKKNQVRVHMQDIGHPVIGDKKYGSRINPIGRLGLHAWVLAFKHPVNHELMRFETSIPRKFERLF